MKMGSTPASTSRRTLVAGVAWSVPAVAGAAAAPAVAASSSCAPTRQMVFGNMGTQDASGVVPPNLLSMSVVHNWGELGKAVTDPATGIVWQVSYTTMTFTNTSAYTITDLVYPQPYMGVAVGAQTDYAGGTWSTSEGLWWWNDPTTGYENPNEPHAGVYIVTMRVAPNRPCRPDDSFGDANPGVLVAVLALCRLDVCVAEVQAPVGHRQRQYPRVQPELFLPSPRGVGHGFLHCLAREGLLRLLRLRRPGHRRGHRPVSVESSVSVAGA